jgi:hypothetical protein
MKDILFTAKQQKREIGWLCACQVAAYMLNVCSILAYRTEWKELWTQLPWALCIGAGLYALTVVLRLAAYGLRRLWQWRK